MLEEKLNFFWYVDIFPECCLCENYQRKIRVVKSVYTTNKNKILKLPAVIQRAKQTRSFSEKIGLSSFQRHFDGRENHEISFL